VVGAGPYGLSVAAHLRARGVRALTLGRVMGFWEHHMPRGMLLRSAWGASSLSDPAGRLTLDAYEAGQPRPLPRPLPAEEFVRYGRWFQQRAVPDVDRRVVTAIERVEDGYTVELDDGERFAARRVVLATGLRSLAHRPAEFDGLDEPLVVHSVDVTDPARFAGLSVAVVGSGQSAVETAALVDEAGASSVELIARAPFVRWLTRGERLRLMTPGVRRLLYAPTDVGPAGLSWVVAMPNLFRCLPVAPRERLAYRSVRPAATGWLVKRTTAVTMTMGRRIGGVQSVDGGVRVRLSLDDGSERAVDRVILATGYRVDVAREPLLGESIRRRVRVRDGYPLLGSGFESSVPGLHFVGAWSAWSFGPIMRFVSGTPFTGHTLARHIGRTPRAGVLHGNAPPIVTADSP